MYNIPLLNLLITMLINESYIHDNLSVSVFGPLMRLSPPPSEKDYCFNLDDSEGVCDLFDVQ